MIRDLLKWVAPGAVTVFGGTMAALAMTTPVMQADLLARGQAELRDNNLSWAHLAMDGRTALVSGTVDRTGQRDKSLALLANLAGVKGTKDGVTIAPLARPFILSATVEDNAVSLSGNVPNSQIRNQLASRIGENAAHLSVRAGQPDDQAWTAGVDFVLANAALLASGSFVLSDLTLTVTGRAKSQQALGALQVALAQHPDGLSLGLIDVEPAIVSPYTWTAQFDGQRIAISGHVPDADLAERYRTADISGRPVATGLSLASGAPPGFAKHSRLLVEQLAKLEHGSASIVDGVSRLTGTPPSFEVAQSVTEALSGPNSIVQLSAPRIADYWVSINRQPGGLLVYDGYVPDQVTLDAFAAEGDADVSFLKFGGGAPVTYHAGVDFGLKLLAQMSEGRVAFNGSALSVSGIAEDGASYRNLQALLDNDLPQGLTIATAEISVADEDAVEASVPEEPVVEESAVEETVVEEPPVEEPLTAAPAPEVATEVLPEAEQVPPADEGEAVSPEQDAPVAEAVGDAVGIAAPSQLALCQDRLAELSAHNAILFQSGNAIIAESANSELDHFADALALCPDTRVFVEGHTDSDGDDQLNLALSVARAEAVVNALIERGVAASRLYAVGYGESQPVADNATQDGKRQNRRIVVTVQDAY